MLVLDSLRLVFKRNIYLYLILLLVIDYLGAILQKFHASEGTLIRKGDENSVAVIKSEPDDCISVEEEGKSIPFEEPVSRNYSWKLYMCQLAFTIFHLFCYFMSLLKHFFLVFSFGGGGDCWVHVGFF